MWLPCTGMGGGPHRSRTGVKGSDEGLKVAIPRAVRRDRNESARYGPPRCGIRARSRLRNTGAVWDESAVETPLLCPAEVAAFVRLERLQVALLPARNQARKVV